MNSLFVYGTLMDKNVLKSLLGSIPSSCEARLRGFRRHQVSGYDFPAIRPAANYSVEGLLIQGLTDSEIKLLDQYEGEFYERVVIEVELGDSVTAQCETYVFKSAYSDLLSDEDWTVLPDKILSEKKEGS